MYIGLHKSKLPNYKKQFLNLYRLTSSAKTYAPRYYVDGTMYSCLIVNYFYPRDNFFLLEKLFLSLVLFPPLLWNEALKKCLYISSCIWIVLCSCFCFVLFPFWPFSPFNVNNSETDKYWIKALPVLSMRNLLTPELASIGIGFGLIFTWPLKSWHLTRLGLGLHDSKPSCFRDLVLPI